MSAEPTSDPTPYAGLTPSTVLDALDAVGLRGDGRLLQLNSYENRVFQVFLEDGSAVVVKFYRPGRWTDEQILEEHAFARELSGQEIPVVAPVTLRADPGLGIEARVLGEHGTLATIDHPPGTRYAVTPRTAGQAPDLEDDEVLRWLGRFLGRLHLVGRERSFAHRRTLSVQTLGQVSRDWLVEHDVPPPDLAGAWRSSVDTALAVAQDVFTACGPVGILRLHGDCHPGNLLWGAHGPHFVDLDDAMNGPAVQDLWMLLSGDRATGRRQRDALLDGYEQFLEFDPREWRLVEALRTLRMVHHSAWLAQRWSDPAFPRAFPFFADAAYWSQQITQLREQAEAMQEALAS